MDVGICRIQLHGILLKINHIYMKLDINRFSFSQMTSNDSGKTSGSGTAGVFITATGLLGFLIGAVDYFMHAKSDIMTQSIIVITIGASLLGYRKGVNTKKQPPSTPVDQSSEAINS